MFYRYEFVPKEGKRDRHLGILTGIDLFFHDVDDILRYSWIFERDLPGPDCEMKNTISYFTHKGNRKFAKAIKKLRTAIENTGVAHTRRIELDNLDGLEILYQDRYQVIVKRTEEFG